MTRPWIWVWAGLLSGALLAVPLCLPASWLAAEVVKTSGGRVLLADADGTLWAGSARLALSSSANSAEAAALSGRLTWQLGLHQARPAVWFEHACCINGQLRVVWQPGLERQVLTLHNLPLQPDRTGAAWGQWPVSLLAGLGAPWNTLLPAGAMQLWGQPFDLVLDKHGQLALQGQLDLVLRDLRVRVSPLDTLGDYGLSASGQGPGTAAALQLRTLRGPLQLQGQGQYTAAGLHFRGQAQAQAGFEAALNNVLNLVGRRQGAVSAFSIG